MFHFFAFKSGNGTNKGLWFAYSEVREYAREICFARIGGSDFCTGGNSKTNNLPKPKEPKPGIQSKKLENKKPWKNEEERKKLEHELDLEIMRRDLEQNRQW